MIFRKYSERLAEFDMLTKRLVLSFRSQDDEAILKELSVIYNTKIPLSYLEIDFIYHYFNCCGIHKLPDFIVFAQLVNLNAKITPAARQLFNKLYLQNKYKLDLNDDVIQIAKTISKT
jgi:hypothetical protein